MTWAADSLAGTVFFPLSGQIDALQPWVKLFNGSPQQFMQNPAGQPVGSQSSGVIGIYQVAITTQPGRLDLILSPAPSGRPGPASIIDVESALVTLMGYFRKVLASQEAIRLALVLNLSKPTPDLAQATAEFLRQTKLKVRDEATDLSFSINIAKNFDGVEGKINRICRWGTGQIQTLTFSVNGFNGAQMPHITTFFACTLQLDINTIPSDQIIQQPQCEKILAAFSLAAKELIADAYTQVLVQR